MKKVLLIGMVALATAVAAGIEHSEFSKEELVALEKEDAGRPEIVKKGLRELREFAAAQHEGLVGLYEFGPERTGALCDAAIERLRGDVEVINVVNGALRSKKFSGVATHSAYTNKLGVILPRALELLERSCVELGSDEWVKKSLRNNNLPVVGGLADDYRGRIEVLALKAALMVLAREGGDWVYTRGHLVEGANFHKTPLPEGVDIGEGFTFLDMHDGRRQLVFPHGGYAFGGQREDEFKGKAYGPEDCSSWIAKLLELGELVSTYDFLYLHNMKFGGYVAEGWEDRCACEVLSERVIALELGNLGLIEAGQIVAYRRFDLEVDREKSETSGGRGHVFLVVENHADGEYLTILEYARSVPEFEGFGLRKISYEELRENELKVLIFEVIER